MKAALLDQRIVAGLGNIYVCEILFRAGVSPRRTAASVAGKSGVTERVERVTATTHDVIVEAIDAGGSSISDFVNVEGELGYFSHNFQVYGREGKPCVSCDSTIRRIVQSGRSTFYCPTASAELPFLFLKLPAEIVLHVERLFAIHTGLFGPLLLEYQVIT